MVISIGQQDIINYERVTTTKHSTLSNSIWMKLPLKSKKNKQVLKNNLVINFVHSDEPKSNKSNYIASQIH